MRKTLKSLRAYVGRWWTRNTLRTREYPLWQKNRTLTSVKKARCQFNADVGLFLFENNHLRREGSTKGRPLNSRKWLAKKSARLLENYKYSTPHNARFCKCHRNVSFFFRRLKHTASFHSIVIPTLRGEGYVHLGNFSELWRIVHCCFHFACGSLFVVDFRSILSTVDCRVPCSSVIPPSRDSFFRSSDVTFS